MRAEEFLTDGYIEEMPLPADWDHSELGADKTFKSRLAYALERAKRLGTGSSRVAMIIEYEGRKTVLKIAKNNKGLAQNVEEVNVLDDGYIGSSSIVIPLIDYDRSSDKPVWIQTELASKATLKTLSEKLRAPNLMFFIWFTEFAVGERRGSSYDMWHEEYFKMKPKWTESDWDTFTEYVDSLQDLLHNTSLTTSDLGRAANWGFYNGEPVIIDLGFTTETSKLYGG